MMAGQTYRTLCLGWLGAVWGSDEPDVRRVAADTITRLMAEEAPAPVPPGILAEHEGALRRLREHEDALAAVREELAGERAHVRTLRQELEALQARPEEPKPGRNGNGTGHVSLPPPVITGGAPPSRAVVVIEPAAPAPVMCPVCGEAPVKPDKRTCGRRCSIRLYAQEHREEVAAALVTARQARAAKRQAAQAAAEPAPQAEPTQEPGGPGSVDVRLMDCRLDLRDALSSGPPLMASALTELAERHSLTLAAVKDLMAEVLDERKAVSEGKVRCSCGTWFRPQGAETECKACRRIAQEAERQAVAAA